MIRTCTSHSEAHLYIGSLTICPAQPSLLLISVPMTALMGEERQGSLHLWWSLMQIGECEVSPHLLGGSPLYFPPPCPQGMCRLHSIHQVRSWVCDGETQRHILTVSQSQGPYGPVQTPPYPLPGQGRAESSLAPPRSPSLHLVPSVIMS